MKSWRVLSVAVAAAVLLAGACYDGPDGADDGPQQPDGARPVFTQQSLHSGVRRALRQSVRVPDPISANSTLELRIRSLGDPAAGEFRRSVINFGTEIENSIEFQTSHGPVKLHLQSDGTFSEKPVVGPLATLAIPAVEDGVLVFRGAVKPFILAGVWRYTLDMSTDGGQSSIEVALVTP